MAVPWRWPHPPDRCQSDSAAPLSCFPVTCARAVFAPLISLACSLTPFGCAARRVTVCVRRGQGTLHYTKLAKEAWRARKSWALCRVVLTDRSLFLFKDSKGSASMVSGRRCVRCHSDFCGTDVDGVVLGQCESYAGHRGDVERGALRAAYMVTWLYLFMSPGPSKGTRFE